MQRSDCKGEYLTVGRKSEDLGGSERVSWMAEQSQEGGQGGEWASKSDLAWEPSTMIQEQEEINVSIPFGLSSGSVR